MTLGDIWFVLIGVLFVGYAIFDGFDLGVGTLYPFLGTSDEEKAVMRLSVGPVWDGNEVWLLTGGGALFAAFPAVYATVFSGFYLALMLLLFALIFRAGAMEFRHRDPAWAKFWDWAFFLGSAIPALLFGVAVGNIVRGVPLTVEGEFIAGSAPTFGANLLAALNPYSIVIGLLGLSWILLHGASWLGVKTSGDFHRRVSSTRSVLLAAYAALFMAGAAATAAFVPDALDRVIGSIAGWAFIAAGIVGIVVTWFAGRQGKDLAAFYGSALGAVSLVGIWAASIFPSLVPSTGAGESLTIANSASSDLTLTVMLIIAGIGVPLVLLYFFIIYRTYAGRIDSAMVADQY